MRRTSGQAGWSSGRERSKVLKFGGFRPRQADLLTGTERTARPIVLLGRGHSSRHHCRRRIWRPVCGPCAQRAPVRLTLLDRRNHHVFQPLLYQVAMAALSPGRHRVPHPMDPAPAVERRGAPGRRPARRSGAPQVVLADGEMEYDYLIRGDRRDARLLRPRRVARRGAGLKTLEDALDIRRRVLLAFERAERGRDPAAPRTLLTFVVIGGGPTGVEMAGALAEISRQSLARDFRHFDPGSARIVLVEAGPSLLTAFPEPLRDAARNDLERLGVEVRTGAMVTALSPGRVEIGETSIEAATVLWAAGVAASPLGATLGVPTDRAGRVFVQPDLTIPGHPDVFVIGDLASVKGADGKPLPGVAQVAIQMRQARGAQHRPRDRRTALSPVRLQGPAASMATIGRASAVADFGWLQLKGWFAWLAWLFVHIMNLIGFRNRLVVLVQWAWAYFSYQRAVRLITGAGTGARPGPQVMDTAPSSSCWRWPPRSCRCRAAAVERWYSAGDLPADPVRDDRGDQSRSDRDPGSSWPPSCSCWRSRCSSAACDRSAWGAPLLRATRGRSCCVAALLYLLFLGLWGLNYRRVPLERKLDYDRSRVTRDGAIALANAAAASINRGHAAAHAGPPDTPSLERCVRRGAARARRAPPGRSRRAQMVALVVVLPAGGNRRHDRSVLPRDHRQPGRARHRAALRCSRTNGRTWPATRTKRRRTSWRG